MENKKNVQQELINFISLSLDTNKFKLLKKENKLNPSQIFTSHKKFISHNTEIINSMSEDELEFHFNLMNMIKSQEIKLLDQEDFYENDAYGFYFNPSNTLVILWNE